MSTTLTIECPACATAFPVDPAKVPAGGARTECTVCHTPFRVDDPSGEGMDELPMDSWEDSAADLDDGAIEGVAAVEEVVTVWDADADADATVTEDAGEIGEDEVAWPADREAEGPEGMEAAVEEWSELVTEETGSFEESGGSEESAATGAWGGGDAEEWVVETEDDGTTLSDLDLDVERLDTVEDEVRAAQEEPGMSGTDADADAFVTDAGEDLLGGNEIVIPEDALEVEGGIAEAGDPEGETRSVDEVGAIEEVEEAGWDEASAEPEEGEEVFQFGRRDPHDKARRLARVLVSDMITYNPERHEEALAQDRLMEDFEEEIEKSWAEYVEQVGEEIAESTSYWKDALNEILARGEPLF